MDDSGKSLVDRLRRVSALPDVIPEYQRRAIYV
jgi:hypothetical protein